MTETATIRCPECGVESRAEMPEDACQYFWECPGCKVVVMPKAGDCCVFCSYSDKKCPAKTRRTRAE